MKYTPPCVPSGMAAVTYWHNNYTKYYNNIDQIPRLQTDAKTVDWCYSHCVQLQWLSNGVTMLFAIAVFLVLQLNADTTGAACSRKCMNVR